MKEEFLGDASDAVKRLWREVLSDWAPLYADPDFIPRELRKDYTRLTGIQMLPDEPPQSFSILNDPDVGVRLPGKNENEGRDYISPDTIFNQVRGVSNPPPIAVITFDQSDSGQSERRRDQQMQEKMLYLSDRGILSFYYVSQAPFLFAFYQPAHRDEVRDRLRKAGIPHNRFKFLA